MLVNNCVVNMSHEATKTKYNAENSLLTNILNKHCNSNLKVLTMHFKKIQNGR